jgi:predicted esterase
LFVFLPGAGYGARQVTDWLRPVADKYGMILLAPTRVGPSKPYLRNGQPVVMMGGTVMVDALFTDESDRHTLDIALQEVLRRFAIDPAKIAIIGRCASGADGMNLGMRNPDVFSRIASISGGVPTAHIDKNTGVEFFIDAGYEEYDGKLAAAKALRRDGHPVKLAIGLRGHEHQAEDYDFLGHWLSESWATPSVAARPKPVSVADPLPLLTPAALTQLTTFWTKFAQEPDSILVTARRAHLREVLVPVGDEQVSLWTMDLAALAAQYPTVAADLKAAGLTAQQQDAYRIALLSAASTAKLKDQVGRLAPASVLAKNIAFLREHPDEVKALDTDATHFWRTP